MFSLMIIHPTYGKKRCIYYDTNSFKLSKFHVNSTIFKLYNVQQTSILSLNKLCLHNKCTKLRILMQLCL